MLWRSVAGVGGLAALGVQAEVKIDAMKHDIQEITARNFDGIIQKNRDVGVSAVWYYRPGNSKDKDFVDTYNEVAKKLKNMIKVTALNCDEHAKVCERDSVTETPHVQFYPPYNPLPRPQFKYEGALEADAIIKGLNKLLVDKTTTLKTVEDYNTFKNKSPTKPKVILFSDKKKVPVILKALSSEVVFHRTVEFAFVTTATEGTDAIMKESGAARKTLPAVMLYQKNQKQWFKPEKGESISFQGLHQWINVVSESGMGDSIKTASGTQEVEDIMMEEAVYEKIRELHAKSHRELCFGQKNVCAIYVKEGSITEKETDMVADFESKYQPKNDRGIKYNWMWVDLAVETEFKAALEASEKKQADKEDRDVETLKYPTMIFVKPPKKKREEKLLTFVKLDNGVEVGDESITDITEKIAGGTSYMRTDLPKFVVRKKPEKKKEEL